jgi:phage recombination protein Bet
MVKKKQGPLSTPDITKPLERLLQKETALCACALEMNEEELQAWVDLHPQVPAKTRLHLLRIARQYRLDPTQAEVIFVRYEKNDWQALISVDGWMTFINRHPAFIGITFSQSSDEASHLDAWIECTIHRSDRAIPISIREYLSEVQGESEIWKQMPRRMLRHKALIQCARLAFGMSASSMSDTANSSEEPENATNHLSSEQGSAPLFKQTTFGTSRASTLKHLLLEGVNT